MREIIENDNSVISCASDEDDREKDVVISVQNVSKKFNIANQNVSSLKAVSYTHLTLPTMAVV